MINWLAKIAKTLWVVWFYTWFVLFFLSIFPCVFLFHKKKSALPFLHWVRRQAVRALLIVAGLPWKIFQKNNLPKEAVFICANHCSFLDILIPVAAFNRKICFVGKKELGKIPLFGLFFSALDIGIDRKNRVTAQTALDQIPVRIANGWDVIIFPEGTTSLDAPQLQPLKWGAFDTAEKHGLDILPMVFLDHWKRFHFDIPNQRMPGTCRIIVNEVICYHQSDVMRDKTLEAMQRSLGYPRVNSLD